MVLGRLTDGIFSTITEVQDGVEEMLFEPVIRLGVTGLSRAGKTVFITSLVANLLDRGRMPQLSAAADGRISAAFIQQQPHDHIARFDYETHLASLKSREPAWPTSTRRVSELRVTLKVQPGGILAGLRGPRNVHLDIIDYPGEWLLDLPLLNQSYEDWSAESIERARSRGDVAGRWLSVLDTGEPSAKLDELVAKEHAGAFTEYLSEAREAGFSACSPGRFLMPGDLAGSPALTFAPLEPGKAKSGTLYADFRRRFEAYKRVVVKPFFRDHFARIDTQVVLVDALAALHDGPQAMEDMRAAMAEILRAFRPGANSWLTSILGKRVERILFAATKADHLHHTQHPQLRALVEAMLRDARDRANFSGATTQAMAIASLRATVEDRLDHEGQDLPIVRGHLQATGKLAAMYPGDLPEDPDHVLNPARQGAEKWLDGDYRVMRFNPPQLTLKPGDGPPHIRLDRAAEFLLGDKLK